MSELAQLPSPILRAAARLHPDQAGLEFREKGKHLRSAQRTLHNDSAIAVNAVDLQYILGEINSYRFQPHDRAPRVWSIRCHHDVRMSRATRGDHPIKLLRRSGLAFCDALDLRRMQRVQLVRILATLGVKPASQREPVSQSCGHRVAGLSLDVTNHAPEPAAQLPQLPSHPTELLRMGVAARLLLGTGTDERVTLSQLGPVGLRFVDELLARPVQQSAVGRMRDRFRLNRRVHHDRRQARLADRAAALGRLDRLGQQPLDAFLADSLAPANQARRIARHLSLFLTTASGFRESTSNAAVSASARPSCGPRARAL
jgi:hypothetical protein